MLVLRLENFVIKLIQVLKNLACVKYHTVTQKFQIQHVSRKYVCAMAFATWTPFFFTLQPLHLSSPKNPKTSCNEFGAVEFVLPTVLILYAINSSDPKGSSPCTSHLSK